MKSGRGRLERQMKAYTRREHDRRMAVKYLADANKAKDKEDIAFWERNVSLTAKEVETLEGRLKAAGVNVETLQPK